VNLKKRSLSDNRCAIELSFTTEPFVLMTNERKRHEFCKQHVPLLLLSVHFSIFHNVLFFSDGCPIHSLYLIVRYERIFGTLTSHNICVTAAMREDLLCKWNIG